VNILIDKTQNGVCNSSSGVNGTCYSSTDCSNVGGSPSGTCASGFGVCCIGSKNKSFIVVSGSGFSGSFNFSMKWFLKSIISNLFYHLLKIFWFFTFKLGRCIVNTFIHMLQTLKLKSQNCKTKNKGSTMCQCDMFNLGSTAKLKISFPW